MEKKLAVIVDNNKEVTTEVANTEMCSSACDVAMQMCSSQNYDACGDCGVDTKKRYLEILEFTHFVTFFSFN